MDYNKIGEFIAKERKEKKMTQAKLAEKLFVIYEANVALPRLLIVSVFVNALFKFSKVIPSLYWLFNKVKALVKPELIPVNKDVPSNLLLIIFSMLLKLYLYNSSLIFFQKKSNLQTY